MEREAWHDVSIGAISTSQNAHTRGTQRPDDREELREHAAVAFDGGPVGCWSLCCPARREGRRISKLESSYDSPGVVGISNSERTCPGVGGVEHEPGGEE
jgi:hypothetical protein